MWDNSLYIAGYSFSISTYIVMSCWLLKSVMLLLVKFPDFMKCLIECPYFRKLESVQMRHFHGFQEIWPYMSSIYVN